MQVSFSCQPCNKPNQSVNSIIVATNAKISKFFKHCAEITKTIEDNFSIFKHANDATETSQFICSETFDGMPKDVI